MGAESSVVVKKSATAARQFHEKEAESGFMLRTQIQVAGIPFVLAVLLGMTTVPGDFVLDDPLIVQKNARIENATRIPALFAENYWRDYAQGRQYRPLTLATFAVERGIWGTESAAGYHGLNAIIYGLCSSVVALIVLRLGMSAPAACAAGLLFACHPIHVEAVAPIVGRSELAAGFFVLVGLWNESGAPGSWRRALGTAIVFLAALFFKETGVTLLVLLIVPAILLPFASLLPALYGSALKAMVSSWRTWVALGLTFIVWLLFRHNAIRHGNMPTVFLDNPLCDREIVSRIAGALEVSNLYHRMVFFPWPLSADYSHSALTPGISLMGGMALVGLLAWVGITVAAGILAVRIPLVGVGIALYICALFPVSNIPFSIGTIFAERLLFLPSAGVCLALGAGIHILINAGGNLRGLTWAALLLINGAGCWFFVDRVGDWRDELSLAKSIVEVQPNSAKGHEKFGFETYKRAQSAPPEKRAALLDLAQKHLERAVSIHPDYPNAHRNLAMVLDNRGRYREAAKHAQILFQIDRQQLRSYATLAKSRYRLKEYRQALEITNEGLRRYPGAWKLYWIRGQVLCAVGRPAEAASELADVVKRNPHEFSLASVYVRSLVESKNFHQAMELLNRIIGYGPQHPSYAELRPKLHMLIHNRGLLYIALGDHESAVKDFTLVLELVPDFLGSRANRAEALIKLERLESARADIDAIAAIQGEEAVKQLRLKLQNRQAETGQPDE